MRHIGAPAAIAIATYFCCLAFLFPGYVDPLTPHHSDLYIPTGLGVRPWPEVLTYPRPAGFVVLKLIGSGGLEPSIAAVIGLVLALVPALVWLIRRLTGQWPPALMTALYSAVLFAHPEFYFLHRHDVLAILSLLLLLAALAAWFRWLDSGSRRTLAICYMLLALIALTKETYMASAVVLLAATAWLRRRRLPAVELGIAVAVMLAGMGYEIMKYREYVGGAAEYRASLHPRVLADGTWFGLRHLFTPVAAAFAVLLAGQSRNAVWLAAGIAALLPNAALPHHRYQEYAWVAAPLVFAPILLLHTRRAMLIAAAATAATLASFALTYRTPTRLWQLEQEKGAARVHRSLHRLDSITAERVLVTGLRTAFHPWQYPDYIRRRFGPETHWTVITPRDGPERVDGRVTLVRARNAKESDHDLLVEYRDDGSLANIGHPGEASLLIPSLRTELDALRRTPGDFSANLRAGATLLEWDWPEAAQPYLQRALEASGGKNPYPHFFLGQVAEARGERDAAADLYARAAALEPANPTFTAALARVRR